MLTISSAMYHESEVQYYGSTELVSPLLEPPQPIQSPPSNRRNIYRRRWYIVTLFALFAMEQGAISNTWGPVSDTVKQVYGWSTSDIAVLSSWNNLIFILAFIPMVKFMLSCGLRATTISCTFALTVGTAFRLIPCSRSLTKVFANISAILCGYANTLGMIGPTALSVTWFPVHERTVATSIVSGANNNIANAVSFLLAKLLVRDLGNKTDSVNGSSYLIPFNTEQNEMRADLDFFMLVEFLMCAVVFIAVVLYFPGRPHNPPSSSAATGRIGYFISVSRIIRLPKFWLIIVPYALPLGIQPAFMTVMDSILHRYGISQDTSNWIGFYSAVASGFAGVFFSWLADKLERQTKLLIVFNVFLGALGYTWFLLIGSNILPSNIICIYTSLIMGGVFANAAVPLLYELACELTFPISEEVTTGFMTALNNLAALAFLWLVSIKSLGKGWVMWCLVGTFWISLPAILSMRAEYNRKDMDNAADDCQNQDESLIGESPSFN